DGDFTDAGEQVFSANGIKVPVYGSITIPVGISGETRMRVSMKFSGAPGPCENYPYGEVEDYTLNILAPVPQPPVADFTGSPTQISVGGSVQFTDLSSNNPTSWLWTFTGGTPTTSTAQNPIVTYDIAGTYGVTLMVTNASGSDVLTLQDYITVIEGGASYCVSQSTSNAKEWIGEIAVSSFTNPSGPSFYSDFTAMTIQLAPGSSNVVTLTPHFSNKSQREFWRIWIDFNADGDFTDAGEEVFAVNNNKNVVTGTLTIPSSASGQTRMRISMKNGSAPTPCGTFTRGEVEDYTVSFISASKPETITSDLEIRIYPVPAAYLLHIDISGNTSAVDTRIYNIQGRLMQALSLESGNWQIDLSAYPTGIYFIKFRYKDMVVEKKFVKL
ncbi:MAG: GEVED domain-containing protein, partial [bacterium]